MVYLRPSTFSRHFGDPILFSFDAFGMANFFILDLTPLECK